MTIRRLDATDIARNVSDVPNTRLDNRSARYSTMGGHVERGGWSISDRIVGGLGTGSGRSCSCACA